MLSGTEKFLCWWLGIKCTHTLLYVVSILSYLLYFVKVILEQCAELVNLQGKKKRSPLHIAISGKGNLAGMPN